jgi:hypothetical protein
MWIGFVADGECGCGSALLTFATSVLGAMPGLGLALGAFYSDWILGAFAGSLVGIPGGDNMFVYWTYFAAKRLPLFLT